MVGEGDDLDHHLSLSFVICQSRYVGDTDTMHELMIACETYPWFSLLVSGPEPYIETGPEPY